MNQVGARSMRPCFGANFSSSIGKWQQQMKKKQECMPWQQRPAAIDPKSRKLSIMMIRSDMAMAKQPSTFVSKISTNIPLYEAPGVLSPLLNTFYIWWTRGVRPQTQLIPYPPQFLPFFV